MGENNQDIATRAFAIEALATALAQAVRYALAAKLDQSVISELKHLQGVVEANRDNGTDGTTGTDVTDGTAAGGPAAARHDGTGGKE